MPKPEWLRIRNTNSPNRDAVEGILKHLNLNTVCAEANCPNYAECFSRKTATFMIMGTNCTRNCRFCNVRHDKPNTLDKNEPQNVADAVALLNLKYVVITSVTRDDLADGGAAFFSETITAIRKTTPQTLIEVLIPDLQGNLAALKTICDAGPDVISHNMETIRRLYDTVRSGSKYDRSLEIVKNIKQIAPSVRSKSGIMVGLGETEAEVLQLMDDLRQNDCEFITIGQYLAPTKGHIAVFEYVNPSIFEKYANAARHKGFAFVASAPLVRSSYNAAEAVIN